jgi:hypothetical protein
MLPCWSSVFVPECNNVYAISRMIFILAKYDFIAWKCFPNLCHSCIQFELIIFFYVNAVYNKLLNRVAPYKLSPEWGVSWRKTVFTPIIWWPKLWLVASGTTKMAQICGASETCGDPLDWMPRSETHRPPYGNKMCDTKR